MASHEDFIRNCRWILDQLEKPENYKSPQHSTKLICELHKHACIQIEANFMALEVASREAVKRYMELRDAIKERMAVDPAWAETNKELR